MHESQCWPPLPSLVVCAGSDVLWCAVADRAPTKQEANTILNKYVAMTIAKISPARKQQVRTAR